MRIPQNTSIGGNIHNIKPGFVSHAQVTAGKLTDKISADSGPLTKKYPREILGSMMSLLLLTLTLALKNLAESRSIDIQHTEGYKVIGKLVVGTKFNFKAIVARTAKKGYTEINPNLINLLQGDEFNPENIEVVGYIKPMSIKEQTQFMQYLNEAYGTLLVLNNGDNEFVANFFKRSFLNADVTNLIATADHFDFASDIVIDSETGKVIDSEVVVPETVNA